MLDVNEQNKKKFMQIKWKLTKIQEF